MVDSAKRLVTVAVLLLAPSGAAANNPLKNSRNNGVNACNALMMLSNID